MNSIYSQVTTTVFWPSLLQLRISTATPWTWVRPIWRVLLLLVLRHKVANRPWRRDYRLTMAILMLRLNLLVELHVTASWARVVPHGCCGTALVLLLPTATPAALLALATSAVSAAAIPTAAATSAATAAAVSAATAIFTATVLVAPAAAAAFAAAAATILLLRTPAEPLATLLLLCRLLLRGICSSCWFGCCCRLLTRTASWLALGLCSTGTDLLLSSNCLWLRCWLLSLLLLLGLVRGVLGHWSCTLRGLTAACSRGCAAHACSCSYFCW